MKNIINLGQKGWIGPKYNLVLMENTEGRVSGKGASLARAVQNLHMVAKTSI